MIDTGQPEARGIDLIATDSGGGTGFRNGLVEV
jgi:hypothetical protein